MVKAFAVLILAGAALLAAAGGASGQRGVRSIITRAMFERMLSHRGDNGCQGAFYTYDAFIEAARKFPRFGTTGSNRIRGRELAAFFGQTSHETSGYCYVKERTPSDPRYYGRGPIQLTYVYNYRRAGRALGLDLESNPDLVSSDPVVAFETAIWFWMTPQSPKPSCHAVMTNGWVPSADDLHLGRHPGYGMTTNIINGGVECGKGQPTDGAKDRVSRYKRFCDMLQVGYGNRDMACENQRPYGKG